VVNAVELENRRFSVTIDDVESVLEENRVQLEDISEGTRVQGVVDHKNQYGVWVNVGAEVIGRLNIPRKFGSRIQVGQILDDIIVERVDLERMKLGLTLDDPEVALEAEPVLVSAMVRTPAKGAAKAQPRQPSRKRQAEARRPERPERPVPSPGEP
ncbi:unnamed protein product, partial [Polarella glacialis]